MGEDMRTWKVIHDSTYGEHNPETSVFREVNNEYVIVDAGMVIVFRGKPEEDGKFYIAFGPSRWIEVIQEGE
jgi:hypothetical protein